MHKKTDHQRKALRSCQGFPTSPRCDLFLEPPTQASADSIPVVNVSRELGLSLSGLFQSYHEQSPFLGLRTLDSEQGWVPGFGAKATAIVDTPPISNVYVAIRYNYNSGTVTYSAPYPFGITRYLRSGETINNVNVEIGKGILLFSDEAILIPLVQAEYRNWDRTVAGGITPNIDYSYFAAGLGLRAAYMLTGKLALTGKVGWQYTIDPKATSVANLNPYSLEPSFLFHLGSGPVWQATIGTDYRISDHVHCFLEMAYSHLGFGHSPETFGSIYGLKGFAVEPKDVTNDLLLQLGVAWGF
jgi:hypothetical protein